MANEVLVLNASYQPLAVVGDRRAVTLLLAGRAESVAAEEAPPVFRSASMVIEIPSILRLHNMVKTGRPRTPPPSRLGVLRRDRHRCGYCGETAETVDHIVPRSRGGASTWTNLVAACRPHNAEKGDRLLHELGWSLRIAPQAPSPNHRFVRGDRPMHPLWEPYLTAS